MSQNSVLALLAYDMDDEWVTVKSVLTAKYGVSSLTFPTLVELK